MIHDDYLDVCADFNKDYSGKQCNTERIILSFQELFEFFVVSFQFNNRNKEYFK